MRIKTFGSVIALSCAATAVVTACGDDTTLRTTEVCVDENGMPKAPECVEGTNQGVRACPAGPDPGWVYFTCAYGQVCDMGACTLDESQAGLLGLCDAGQKECVSDALARQCAAGGDSWGFLACAIGTVCENGDCVPGNADGGVQVCNPGAVQCATEYAVKTCQDDGSDWLVTLCASNELCQNGACVENLEQECMPNTSMCSDSSGGVVCRDDGSGYDAFECPESAPCDGFKCMGTVCTPGETKCEDPAALAEEMFGPPNAVVGQEHGQLFGTQELFRCNDAGDGWDVSSCDSDEFCVYSSLTPSEISGYEDLYMGWLQELNTLTKDAAPRFVHPPNRFMEASCTVAPCTYSTSVTGQELVCGDPNDQTDEKVDSFSRCEGLVPFRAPQWVPYMCEAPLMCDPEMLGYYGSDPCSADCIEGETVCDSYFGGDVDGVRVCDANGEWGPVATTCNPGVDEALTCYQHSQEFGELRSAQCVDPLCVYVWNNYGGDETTVEVGVCDGDALRTCDADGVLADASDAVACASGVCRGQGTQINSNELGMCLEECVDGEQMCLDQMGPGYGYYGDWGPAFSPFYLECEDGVWNRAPVACADDAACFQTRDFGEYESTSTAVICGAECNPGFRQCSLDGLGIETCGVDGMWGAADTCAVGSCRNEQPDYGVWDAECVFDCVPGHYTGRYTFFSDAGLSAYEVAQCDENGRFEDTYTRCGFNDSFDSRMGCVECYGQELAYYYDREVDSQCDDDGTILWCGADNHYPAQGVDCGAGLECLPGYNGRAYCGPELPDPPTPDAGDGG